MTSTHKRTRAYTHPNGCSHRPALVALRAMEQASLGIALEEEARVRMVLEVYLGVLLVDRSFMVVGGLVQLAATEERLRLGFLGPVNDP